MAIPTDHAWREYLAFLRGPVGLNTFAFGTVSEYRGGVDHAGLLQEYPAPTENASDEFGIQTGGNVVVEIADEPDDLDWYLLLEDGSRIVLEDGSGCLVMEY